MRTLLNRVLNRLAYVLPGGSNMRPMLHRLRGVKMGKNVWVGLLVYIDEWHPEAISIGDNCSIGLRTSIFSHFYWGPRRPDNPERVIIERDVFIGPHCLILANVRIGEGAVITAGTVVTTDVPAHALWGIPPAGPLARVSVPLIPENSYADFLQGLRPVDKDL